MIKKRSTTHERSRRVLMVLEHCYKLMAQYDELVQQATADEPDHYKEWSDALFAARDILNNGDIIFSGQQWETDQLAAMEKDNHLLQQDINKIRSDRIEEARRSRADSAAQAHRDNFSRIQLDRIDTPVAALSLSKDMSIEMLEEVLDGRVCRVGLGATASLCQCPVCHGQQVLSRAKAAQARRRAA